MPYDVEKRGNGPRPWKILKHGNVIGSSTSRIKAYASISHREKGAGEKPKKRRKK